MELAQNFVKWDPNEETRKVIEDLISKGDIDTLNKLLGSRMAFGTAGLRGPMGAGFNHMNDLVILQTSQGLAKYIEKVQGDEAKAKVRSNSLLNFVSSIIYSSRVLLLDMIIGN